MTKRRRIHRNPQNTPLMSLPLTGPGAIALRFPVAGVLTLPDGQRLLISEGEFCHTWPMRCCQAWPENVLPAESRAA